MARKKAASLLPKLTETEQDLLSHIQNGYQLETDSLGGNPPEKRHSDPLAYAWSCPRPIAQPTA
jgi:hypothetical protein